MSDYRVLISCPLIVDSLDEYADRFAEHGIDYDIADVDQQLTEAELLDVIDRYDGVLAGDDDFTRQVLASADRLKVIAKWGIGTDNIDEETAEEYGITVSNTPKVFGDEVADVVIGYAIMLTRQLHLIDRAVRDGEWACPRGMSLAGKTFGVVGVGDIGSSVARRAYAHGLDVLGSDVRPFPADLSDDIDIERVEMSELLAAADLVSLNCALTEETRGMIGSDELEAIGEEGYLINTARGELVGQDALIEALREGRLAGAALDVFAEEPLSASSQLVSMENVILGSHNAQNTHEAVARVNKRAVENLIESINRWGEV